MTWKYYEKSLHWIWRQSKDLCRRQEDIGFQNFLVTYWPSSWLRPFSLRGAVSWSWISNASLTLQSNLRSSGFRILVSSHLNPVFCMERNTRSLPFFICNSFLVLWNPWLNFKFCFTHIPFSTITFYHIYPRFTLCLLNYYFVLICLQTVIWNLQNAIILDVTC